MKVSILPPNRLLEVSRWLPSPWGDGVMKFLSSTSPRYTWTICLRRSNIQRTHVLVYRVSSHLRIRKARGRPEVQPSPYSWHVFVASSLRSAPYLWMILLSVHVYWTERFKDVLVSRGFLFREFWLDLWPKLRVWDGYPSQSGTIYASLRAQPLVPCHFNIIALFSFRYLHFYVVLFCLLYPGLGVFLASITAT
jgi:hypothetical protein